MAQQNETLKTQAQKIANLATIDQELKSAYANLDECNIQINEVNSTYIDTKKELREVKQQLEVTEFKYEHEKNMRTQKHSKLEGCQKKNANFNETLAEKDLEIEDMMVQFNNKELEHHECKVELNTKISEMGMIQLDMFNQKSEIEMYKMDAQRYQDEALEQEETNKQMHQELLKINREKFKAINELKDVKANAEQQATTNLVQKAKIEELQEELLDYKKFKATSMVQEVRIKELQEELQNAKDQAKAALEASSGSSRSLQTEIQKLTQNKNVQEIKIRELSDDLNQFRESKQEEIQTLNFELKSCEAKAKQAAQQVASRSGITGLPAGIDPSTINMQQVLANAGSSGITLPGGINLNEILSGIDMQEAIANAEKQVLANIGSGGGDTAALQKEIAAKDTQIQTLMKQKNEMMQDLRWFWVFWVWKKFIFFRKNAMGR